ncbi:S8 family serine peptidase [Chitinophaga nivalis]|uniref:S8 family serine peptidase n=1 Tax=Chitinophaga nivalis TaxID=2991709 RepID=A0ABT3IGP5_9BACT|nr:S8 family serine peptidase [Chitinophaga nivalis]MCW3467328.1 S8 family serine peptidase [Chitinophaga nivalis]MCW3482980.1 S8 family serine peptidase [Chitinophaga nivalis]
MRIMKLPGSAAIALLCLTIALFSCRKDNDPYSRYRDQEPLPAKYRNLVLVSFTDKKTTPFSLTAPQAYLSQRAIERRQRQQIKIDSTDLPVAKPYLDSVLRLVKGRLIHTSRWLNYAVIQYPDDMDPKVLSALSFVNDVRPWGLYEPESIPELPGNDMIGGVAPQVKTGTDTLRDLPVSDKGYGRTWKLMKMHKAKALHEAGYRGKGKLIAVLSDGFGYLHEKNGFSHLFRENKIAATYDFVNNQENVYNSGDGGTYLTGIMAGLIPGEYVGLAPEASFALLRVEANATEEPVDETSWIAAMEYADSIGTDIVSSSSVFGLYFDDPAFNIRPEEANGKTAMSSRVADAAFAKGMLVVQMLNGGGARKIVAPPADAFNVITAGNLREYNGRVFDDYSPLNTPTADGRMKPELGALSSGVPILDFYGDAYDLAYSPPIIAGLTACLWQAYPNKTATDIRQLLFRASGDGSKPNNIRGYGLTDFEKALLSGK